MGTSPPAVLSALADRAEQVMHAQRQLSITGLLRLPTLVDGRVFRRLHQFAWLPHEVKAQTDALAVYLGSPGVRDELFTTRHWLSVRAHGRAVGPVARGRALLAAILKFLVLSRAANASEHTARQLAELLVLSGFVSPVHEPEDEPRDGSGRSDANGLSDELLGAYVKPKEYYELVSAGLLRALAGQPQATAADDNCESLSLSVWDVVDGATRAGTVFRKQPPSTLRSLLAVLTLCGASPPQGHERQQYVVVNHVKHGAVVVFDDDVSRRAVAYVRLADAMVAYDLGVDGSPMYHGLRLWTDDHTERFDFMARREQHAWLLSLLDGGARYKETHARFQQIIASPFYACRDVDAAGVEFALHDVADGHVVLLVNVASNDPEAALQYPQLVTLWETYKRHGFVVLACPSSQFLELELATAREVVAHIAHAYGAQFRCLATRDVNGPRAREPFLYCNAHLPGAFGPFTEWNFTKFLIDRHGKPFRRYETHVLPREMERDVRRLLGLHGREEDEEDGGRREVAEELAPARVAAQIEAHTSCQPECGGGHGEEKASRGRSNRS